MPSSSGQPGFEPAPDAPTRRALFDLRRQGFTYYSETTPVPPHRSGATWYNPATGESWVWNGTTWIAFGGGGVPIELVSESISGSIPGKTLNTYANDETVIALPSAGVWLIGHAIDLAGSPTAYGAVMCRLTLGSDVNQLPNAIEAVPFTQLETSPPLRMFANGRWLIEVDAPVSVVLRYATFTQTDTLSNGGRWTATRLGVVGSAVGGGGTPAIPAAAGMELGVGGGGTLVPTAVVIASVSVTLPTDAAVYPINMICDGLLQYFPRGTGVGGINCDILLPGYIQSATSINWYTLTGDPSIVNESNIMTAYRFASPPAGAVDVQLRGWVTGPSLPSAPTTGGCQIRATWASERP